MSHKNTLQYAWHATEMENNRNASHTTRKRASVFVFLPTATLRLRFLAARFLLEVHNHHVCSGFGGPNILLLPTVNYLHSFILRESRFTSYQNSI